MPKKYRLFSDVTSVSRGAAIRLASAGFTNSDGTVVSWARLAPKLRDREPSQLQAKQLILIELEQPAPRADLVRRLVSYLSYSGKEQTMEAVEKLLNN